MLKKIISIFLTAALLISVLPVLASAENTEIFQVEVDASTSTLSDSADYENSPIIYNQGVMISVEIRASQNTGVSALDLVIDYDEDLLEVVEGEYMACGFISSGDTLTHVTDSTGNSFFKYYGENLHDVITTKNEEGKPAKLAVITFLVKAECADDVSITVAPATPKFSVIKVTTGGIGMADVPFDCVSESFSIHKIKKSEGVVTDPDCTNEGYTTFTCLDCGEEVIGNVVAANGHDPLDPVPDESTTIEPSCTEDGSVDMVIICGVCEEELERFNVTLAATGHTPGEAVKENDIAPDCENAGSVDFVTYCTVCNEELNRITIPYAPLGHTPGTPVQENLVAPDCDTDGSFDLVTYCTTCGEELDRETIVNPATGHTELKRIENEVNVGCENDGTFDVVTYCSVCNEVLDRQTIVSTPAHGHKPDAPVIENLVAEDCDTDGSYDLVTYCTVCSEKISSETVKVPAFGHAPGDVLIENEKPATCDEAGSYDRVTYCLTCNEEIARETVSVPALDHKPGEAVKENEVASTCSKAGSYDLVTYCEVCSEELSRVTEVIALAEHELVHHEGQEATHTQVGWKEYDTCKNCDYTTYEEIPVVPYLPGDLNGDDVVTDADAIYLLYATFDEANYPLNQEADFNGDGEVTDADAIYLLYATFDPENYTLG